MRSTREYELAMSRGVRRFLCNTTTGLDNEIRWRLDQRALPSTILIVKQRAQNEIVVRWSGDYPDAETADDRKWDLYNAQIAHVAGTMIVHRCSSFVRTTAARHAVNAS